MAQRAGPGQSSFGAATVGAALSGAAVGVVLTYTVPAGRNAMLRWMSAANFTNAPTVQLRVTVGGTTVVLASGTTAFSVVPSMALNAGDTATINVSVLAAGGLFDGAISAEEWFV